MTLLENEAAQFRSADGEVKYSQATGNFQTLSLRQRRDGSFSGDTGKLHSFTQAVSPYLIAITTRSRRVFHVKQMRVISPFPASTLRFTGRLWFSWMVFICQNDSPCSSCEQPFALESFSGTWLELDLKASHLISALPPLLQHLNTPCKINCRCKCTPIFAKDAFAKS